MNSSFSITDGPRVRWHSAPPQQHAPNPTGGDEWNTHEQRVPSSVRLAQLMQAGSVMSGSSGSSWSELDLEVERLAQVGARGAAGHHHTGDSANAGSSDGAASRLRKGWILPMPSNHQQQAGARALRVTTPSQHLELTHLPSQTQLKERNQLCAAVSCFFRV